MTYITASIHLTESQILPPINRDGRNIAGARSSATVGMDGGEGVGHRVKVQLVPVKPECVLSAMHETIHHSNRN